MDNAIIFVYKTWTNLSRGRSLFEMTFGKATAYGACVAPGEEERLILELKQWAGMKRGRQQTLADELGVSRKTVSAWIARNHFPNVETFFKVQAFLKRQRKEK